MADLTDIELLEYAEHGGLVVSAMAAELLALREQTRWRPIAEAPRDGTVIIGWNAVWTTSFSVYWTKTTEDSKDGGWTDGSTNRWEEYCAYYPTLWMASPVPPISARTAAQDGQEGE